MGLLTKKSVAVWLSLGVAGLLTLGANVAGLGAPPLPGMDDAAPFQTAGRIEVNPATQLRTRIPIDGPVDTPHRISIDDAASQPSSSGRAESRSATLTANEVRISADTVKQGEVLRVEVSAPDTISVDKLTFAGRTAPFFRQDDGTLLALASISVFEAPGAKPLVLKDAGGNTLFVRQIEVKNAWYRTQNVRVSKSTEGLQPLPGEIETIQKLKDTLTPVKFWSEPFITPTPDCQNSPFGVKRYHNGKATGDFHKGVDLRSPAGRPIRATSGGRVQIATMYRLHGGTVGLDHGQGVESIYIHMSRIAVKPGDMVKKGDVIGYVGSTGFASGPHLHWGLYVNGLPVNPNQWIKGVPSCG